MNVKEESKLSLKRENDWMCVVFNLQAFLSLIIGVRFMIYDAFISTTLFGLLLVQLGILGLTAGAHRLWAHQSYKASMKLKIFLMLCQTLTFRGPIYEWVRRHRVHHKHFGTDLDPFNPAKGFLFSHFIGNNQKFSEAQQKALSEVDMSDLEADGVVMFQKKYYWFILFVVGFLLPANAPAEYWGETILNSIFITGWFRYTVLLNVSYLIHSATTVWGLQSNAREATNSNLVFLINKTHWLSYHYITPWDYRTSEFGKYGTDCTSKFIQVCAALEMATDLKTTDTQAIRKALAMSIDENIPVDECLNKLKSSCSLTQNQVLAGPAKLIL